MNDIISANAEFARGNYENAARIYQELAFGGDLCAMFNMGYLHQFGIGVPLDYEKAVDFYSVAIYLEGGDAAYNLAVMQMNGQGTPRNIGKALRTMETSANLGCPEAQLYLATAYAVGYAGNPVYSNICRIPFHKAEQKYDFAVLDGNTFDEEEQAKIEQERCISAYENEVEAFRFLSLAAENEDEDDVYGNTIRDAKYLLGLFKIEGIGCRIDKRLGEKLIREAAMLGSSAAKQYLLSETKK